MTPIAIFASGSGSNFDAILRAIEGGKLSSEITCLVSDQPDAFVVKRATEKKIPTVIVPADLKLSGNDRRRKQEEKILTELRSYSPEFLVLAGYMRILTREFLDEFRSPRGYAKIVNVHPSLLPSFPGTDGYAQAFRHGCKVTGVSVHLVDDALDGGPICAQEAFEISDCRSVEEVKKRGLAVEHRIYPEALSWILPEEFTLEERLVRKN